MNFKKIVATLAAAALSVSALSVSAMALSTKDYLKDGVVYVNADKPEDPTWAIDAGVAQTDVYGVTFHVTFEGNDEWYGGGIGANSNSTGWKSIEWGTNSKEITADVENGTITWLSNAPVFAESDEYAQLWLQTWTGKVTVNSADVLGKDGVILSTDDAPAETEAAETEESTEETAAETEATEAEETEAETTEAETEAEVEETAAEETEAAEEAAPAIDYSALTGDVISDTEATSAGAWGQAITLTTVKNDNGVFDPAVLTPDKAVVVYYTADTAPEVVLQSWSGGEGWAKVPADETLSTDGVAVFTYDYMTAMYQSDDFVDTLDAFIVGDTGSELTVSKVLLVDAASLTEGAASDEDVVEDAAPVEETEAPVEEVVTEAPAEETTAPAADTTTPVASTGNTAAASIAAVMAVAGAAAVISKRK